MLLTHYTKSKEDIPIFGLQDVVNDPDLALLEEQGTCTHEHL